MATSTLSTLSANFQNGMRFPAFTTVSKLHLSLLFSTSLRRSSDSLATSTLSSSSDLTTRKDLVATLLQPARVSALRLRQLLRTLMSKRVFKKQLARLSCNALAPCASYQDCQKLSQMSLLSQQSNCSTPHQCNHLDRRRLTKLSSTLSP
jgi:hypothetical protein